MAVVRSFDVDGGGKGLESKSRFPLCLERAFDVFLSFGSAFSLDRIFVHFYFWDLFRLVSIFYENETHFRCLIMSFNFTSFGSAFSLDRIFVNFYSWDLFRLVSIFYETHFR